MADDVLELQTGPGDLDVLADQERDEGKNEQHAYGLDNEGTPARRELGSSWGTTALEFPSFRCHHDRVLKLLTRE